jgi:hypothetical protein
MFGMLAYYLLFLIAFGSSWSAAFPDLQFLMAEVLAFITFGLGTLFPGFVAIAVANFRNEKQLGSKEPPAQSTTGV